MKPRVRIAIPLLIVILSCLALAQRRSSGESDSVTLIVRLSMPDGRAAPSNLRVDLFNHNGIRIGGSSTDGSGQADFGSVSSGIYQVQVSGPGISPQMYQFAVSAGFDPMHFEEITIKPVASSDSSGQASQGTVSALDLKAPPEAKKEVEKGGDAVNRKDWPEARKHYEKALEIYPDYPAAYNNLGVVLMRSGEAQKAREVLGKAVGLGYTRAYVNLARLDSGEHKFKDAEDLLKKALAQEPANAQAMFLLAHAEYQLHEYDDAIAIARKVHAGPHEDYAGAHYVCALALRAEGKNADAAAELRTFLQEAPNSEMATRARADLQTLEAHP